MTNLIFPTLPTQEEIDIRLQNVGTYDMIKSLEKLRVHVSRPSRPDSGCIKIKTAQEHREYADKLEQYEKEMEEYKVQDNMCKIHNLKVDTLILDFIKNEAGLNSIPEQYRNKVFSKAWSDGHSDGYYEVFMQLSELINIFD
jgi:hypothetical protein